MLHKEVEEKIQARVQEHYDYLIKRMPVERIIGVFAYGSMNYGFYEDGVSDVDTKAIVLPSFENLMGGHNLISKEYILENGEHCEVKDIRLSSKANAQVLVEVSRAISPYAIAQGGESVADVTNKLLRGTSLEQVINQISDNIPTCS